MFSASCRLRSHRVPDRRAGASLRRAVPDRRKRDRGRRGSSRARGRCCSTMTLPVRISTSCPRDSRSCPFLDTCPPSWRAQQTAVRAAPTAIPGGTLHSADAASPDRRRRKVVDGRKREARLHRVDVEALPSAPATRRRRSPAGMHAALPLRPRRASSCPRCAARGRRRGRSAPRTRSGCLRIVSSIWRRARCVSTSASPVWRRSRRMRQRRSLKFALQLPLQHALQQPILSRTSSASGMFACSAGVFSRLVISPHISNSDFVRKRQPVIALLDIVQHRIELQLAVDHAVEVGARQRVLDRGRRSS